MTATPIDVGGPEVYTSDAIAVIAYAAGTPASVSHFPLPLARTGVGLLRPIRRRTAQLLDFFVSSAALDSVAP